MAPSLRETERSNSETGAIHCNVQLHNNTGRGDSQDIIVMGAGQSSASTGPEAPVAGVGVASLVREIGLAMIPAHLRHTLDSITQIIGR